MKVNLKRCEYQKGKNKPMLSRGAREGRGKTPYLVNARGKEIRRM